MQAACADLPYLHQQDVVCAYRVASIHRCACVFCSISEHGVSVDSTDIPKPLQFYLAVYTSSLELLSVKQSVQQCTLTEEFFQAKVLAMFQSRETSREFF